MNLQSTAKSTCDFRRMNHYWHSKYRIFMYLHQDINSLPVQDLALSTMTRGWSMVNSGNWLDSEQKKNAIPGNRKNVHIWILAVLRMGPRQSKRELITLYLSDSINFHGFPGSTAARWEQDTEPKLLLPAVGLSSVVQSSTVCSVVPPWERFFLFPGGIYSCLSDMPRFMF